MREFVQSRLSLSETAFSLAEKLGVDRRVCRRVLDQLVSEGLLQRKEFEDIEPIFYRR